MGVCTKVPIEQCLRATGKQPIRVRWVDLSKQEDINLKYRSRLVGKEYNTGRSDELYASTPPLEALRMVVSEAAISENWPCLRRLINSSLLASGNATSVTMRLVVATYVS